MEILFKTTDTAPENALVEHTNFKDFTGAIHRKMAWSTLAVYIEPAIRNYILPHIGREWYDGIADIYQNDGAMSSSQSEALGLMQRAAAFYTVYDCLPDLNVQLAAMGPQQTSDSEGTSNPPSQWSYKAKRWNALLQADQAVDQLLQFLDAQIKADNTDFELYAQSEAYQQEGSDFFRSVTELDQFLNLQGSRRAYARIVKYFRKAERRYILPVLGSAFYNELRDQYKAGSLTEANIIAHNYVQTCLAEYGLLEAIPHIGAVLRDDSIVIVSSTDGFDRRSSSNTIFGQAMIDRVQQHTELAAAQSRRELIYLLQSKADEDYPTYRASDAYAEPSSGDSIYSSGDGEGAIYL